MPDLIRLAFTGHRPPSLGGYDDATNQHNAVKRAIHQHLVDLGPDCCIVGGAQGVDMWAAEVCQTLQIPYDLYQPCIGQANPWPLDSQIRWTSMRDRARTVHLCYDGPYIPGCMNARNSRMLVECTHLCAVWNGSQRGGTWDTIRKARSNGALSRPIHYIDPRAL